MKTLILAVSVLGAVSVARGATIIYTASLSGAAEATPNESPAIGFTTVTLDTVANTMRLQISFSGLTGTTTAAHIHAATSQAGTGTSGVATMTPSFVGFPLGVSSGSSDQTYDMTSTSSFNSAYVTAHGGTATQSWADLQAAMAEGKAYLNIHTSTFTGGEIRGFLAVPEPGTTGLLGVAGIGLLLGRRRK